MWNDRKMENCDENGRSKHAVKCGMIGGRMNRTPGKPPYPVYKIECNHCKKEYWTTGVTNIKCCTKNLFCAPGKRNAHRYNDVAIDVMKGGGGASNRHG
mmetsp:Transcript_34736/g.37567  ORF Transcript_34736/g.37567 Transcript_34736/m.37567 type:complete len:99 (+) Transcript_34736:1086-1382(+)